MSVEDNIRLEEEILKAYNLHDLGLYARFYADEREIEARLAFQRDFWLPAFPDTHMEVTSLTAQGNFVVTEAIVRATHSGPLKLWVKEPVPATYRKIEFAYCGVTEFAGGKVKAHRAYINPGTILGQLGATNNVDWAQFS